MGIEADGPERPPHDVTNATPNANTASRKPSLLVMTVLRQERAIARIIQGMRLSRRTGIMTRVNVETGRYLMSIVLAIALASVGAASNSSSQEEKASGGTTRRMADGRQWTTHNLNVKTADSYCFEDSEQHCRQYGRLYTWESARRACQSLGTGWRLPTDDEWREMAKHYGGVGDDSQDNGRAAYAALLNGGNSRFDAVLGGNRSSDGEYARLQAHGFYWTASERDQRTAPFYNFGRGSQALFRQSQGDKQMAISVRCVRD